MEEAPSSIVHIIGIQLGLIFYGVYICLFIYAIRIIRSKLSHPHVIGGVLACLFVLCTATMAVRSAAAYGVLVNFHNREGILSHYVNGLYIAGHALWLISSQLADALLIWRLYHVWKKSWRVIVLPIFLWLAVAASETVVIVYDVVVPKPELRDIRLKITVFGFVGLILMLSLNLLVTGLIWAKLKWNHSLLSDQATLTKRMYTTAINAVCQSSMLYSTFLTIHAILYITRLDGAVCLILCLLPPILALSPTLVVIKLDDMSRAGKNMRQDWSTLEEGRKSRLTTQRKPPNEASILRFATTSAYKASAFESGPVFGTAVGSDTCTQSQGASIKEEVEDHYHTDVALYTIMAM